MIDNQRLITDIHYQPLLWFSTIIIFLIIIIHITIINIIIIIIVHIQIIQYNIWSWH